MSEQRLVLPRKPQHHKHRFLAAVVIGGLAVAGIWGFQMKSTFDRFAAERSESGEADAFAEARENLEQQEDAMAIQESLDMIRNFMADIARDKVAAEQAAEQTPAETATETQVGAAADTTLTPAVAGETTEAN